MSRAFEKQTVLGLIRKELRSVTNGFAIYTMVNGKESYCGTIDEDMDSAMSLQLKEQGFAEV